MNKYTGKITMHFEMGCGHWAQFHDDRGLSGDTNQFWDWSYTINLTKKKIERLFIYNDDGVVLYDGPWTYDRKNTCNTEYYIPSPKEISGPDWLKIFTHQEYLNCEIETELTVPGEN